MKKYIVIAAVIFSVIVLFVTLFYMRLSGEKDGSENNKVVYLRYSFLVKNKGEKPLDGVELKMFSPYTENKVQTLVGLVSNVPLDVIKEKYDGFSFVIKQLSLPPYGSKSITVTMEVAISRPVEEQSVSGLGEYLKNGYFLDMGSSSVKAVAATLNGSDVEEVAENIYSWLISNVKNSRYIAEAKGAKFAIEEKTGDCTELMYAFMALARLREIPTRGVGGFIVEGGSTVVHANDYHNWVEYFNGKHWVVVDPQNEVFGDLKGKTYVVFRYLGGELDSGLMTQRFVTTNTELQISML